jgi:hypothetical protein
MNGLAVKTTQIAFPETISSAVYRTGVYASHGQNSTTNASDNVFSDGVQGELATVAGADPISAGRMLHLPPSDY